MMKILRNILAIGVVALSLSSIYAAMAEQACFTLMPGQRPAIDLSKIPPHMAGKVLTITADQPVNGHAELTHDQSGVKTEIDVAGGRGTVQVGQPGPHHVTAHTMDRAAKFTIAAQ